jgi:hypothetical protein
MELKSLILRHTTLPIFHSICEFARHNKPRHASASSRSVEMTLCKYNSKPVSDFRPCYYWRVRTTLCQIIMKTTRHILFAVCILLCSCQNGTNTSMLPAVRDTMRVSDEYSRSKVSSYEVYEWPVSNHCMAMMTLKSGRKFPMLCRRQTSSIYPIPQSVFATNDPSRFRIMCEPTIEKRGMNAHCLMQISVLAESKGLSDGIHLAPMVYPTPSLIEQPKEEAQQAAPRNR